ncbi:uncharacterized protein AC631_02015 [Debaryomyces fabryi]|uniref:LicD/FKTN/FKRP nucleotidyltransferase domain-containing protein n=1 Tax=Debaryomyces fabryi TaxID=58627 RepID=A0A0V1Q1N1_9ASCO|nr:uncharacterized protein AC631_02015 [Debaryomyces fabryi]KSA02197.1 hypothetical protein AC631_02015 [Debaryomyces fabryi]CUM46561.1 unnamed protein product [Debaryomyces fabryi]
MAKPIHHIIKRACLVIIIVNAIYLTSCLIFYSKDNESIIQSIKNSIITPTYSYTHLEATDQDEATATNYGEEIKKLLEEVKVNKDNKYWLTNTKLSHTKLTVNANDFTNNSQSETSWKNKNSIFYDPRLTLSLYINYIKHNSGQEVSKEDLKVPFDWADWVDLTLLNEDLAQPLADRKNCDWIKKFTKIDQNSDISAIKCMDNSDLSPKLIKNLGFDSHEQLPGYVVYGYCENRAFHDTRIAQGKSYIFTHLQNPYKLIFLNRDGGTYEVDVEGTKSGIAKSGLMNEYLSNNFGNNKDVLKKINVGSELNLEFDPTKEFKSLKKEEKVQPMHLKSNEDSYKMYELLHNKDITKSPDLHLPNEAFHYSSSIVHEKFTLLERLRNLQDLTRSEDAFYNSLKLSREHNGNSEPAYFQMSTLSVIGDPRNADKDQGWHYDWRFFNGGLTYEREGWTKSELTIRTNIILERLVRNWFRFAEEKGLVSWLMHGPLLSWYWNGLTFPFDNDIDIQMPVKELVRLGENYNQTLVIEDLEEGYGKYLIDVGTFIHNRDISTTGNHIDARLIDVDSGIYIDITGLSTSDAPVPQLFYTNGVFGDKEKDMEKYNDRRKHFYTLDQLAPLKYSMLGGVPAYVPNKISSRLHFEYPSGLTRPEYLQWHFVPKLGLWLSEEQLKGAFDVNDYSVLLFHDSHVDKLSMMELVLDMSDEEMYKLLKSDDMILSEYYNTQKLTKLHEREKKYLFNIKNESATGSTDIVVEDRTELKSNAELELEYNKFVNKNFKMRKPSTIPLFQYERFEQPSHHEK